MSVILLGCVEEGEKANNSSILSTHATAWMSAFVFSRVMAHPATGQAHRQLLVASSSMRKTSQTR
jgi:hypothetical protein